MPVLYACLSGTDRVIYFTANILMTYFQRVPAIYNIIFYFYITIFRLYLYNIFVFLHVYYVYVNLYCDACCGNVQGPPGKQPLAEGGTLLK